jgi:hypothetical protein
MLPLRFQGLTLPNPNIDALSKKIHLLQSHWDIGSTAGWMLHQAYQVLFCLWSSQQPHKTQQNELNMYYVYVGIGREFTKLPQRLKKSSIGGNNTLGATMLLSATSNSVGVNVRLVGYGLFVSRYQGITHPCGNIVDVKPEMQKNKRENHEGTYVGQRIGICGGSVELVKRKRETLEGTCVGLSIGIG